MQKLTFDLPELKQIEINGEVFDVLKADLDILNKALEIETEFSRLSDKQPRKVAEAIKKTIGFIDELLGEGATKKIVKDRPLGLLYSVSLMTKIAEAVVREYSEEISKEYE